MKNRPIYNSDLPTLRAAMDSDKFHPGQWKVEDFRGFSEVFEDKDGPAVFVHYDPEGERLHISTVWCTPDKVHRNGRAIIFLVHSAASRAAGAGFKELVFNTTYDKLANFCMRALGFASIGGTEYVLPLEGI